MKPGLSLGGRWLSGGLMVLLLFVSGCSGRAVARSTGGFPDGTGFVCRQAQIEGQPHELWLFIPREYDSSKKWPAILFLHGLFEAGSDGDSALTAGLGPVIAESAEDWPFVVIFPQSNGTWKGPQRERLAMGSLDWVESEYSIDPNRVILAGLSYGGLGAWQIGARHSDRFAAIVPVSGRRDLASVSRLTRTPVWAFHSRGDPFISFQASQAMCEQISEQGGNARLTIFPVMDHDCWDRAVEESELVEWMLRQRRAPAQLTASLE